jgi:hypothetical protein
MYLRSLCLCAFVFMFGLSARAQDASVRVEVRSEGKPVAGASVVVNGVAHEADDHGLVTVAVPAGAVDIGVTKAGFGSANAFGGARRLVQQNYVLIARVSFAQQRQTHRFGDGQERDQHNTAFGQVTVRRAIGQTWVIGAAVEHDVYVPRDVPRFAYIFTVPGVFAQDDVKLAGWFSLSASARVDVHSEYRTFASPRLAALLRRGSWSSRASILTGFFAPTALTEETEAAGLSRLSIPTAL